MNISIIGTGNIAHFMAGRLFRAGCNIVDVYDRQFSKAKKLAGTLNSTPAANFNELSENTDAFIFAVSDDALEKVAQQLPFRNKVWIHCSGTQSPDILKVGNAGVIWPLYSINKDNLPVEKSIPLFYESHGKKAEKTVREIAVKVSPIAQFANLKMRRELHLSAVFVNNFVNHLMAITSKRMEQLGLDFNNSLKPIIEETIETALKGLSGQNQTGPAIRHDSETMKQHLQILSEHPEWQEIYRSLSKSIQQFYTISKEK